MTAHQDNFRVEASGETSYGPGTHTIMVVLDRSLDPIEIKEMIADKLADLPAIIEDPVRYE